MQSDQQFCRWSGRNRCRPQGLKISWRRKGDRFSFTFFGVDDLTIDFAEGHNVPGIEVKATAVKSRYATKSEDDAMADVVETLARKREATGFLLTQN